MSSEQLSGRKIIQNKCKKALKNNKSAVNYSDNRPEKDNATICSKSSNVNGTILVECVFQYCSSQSLHIMHQRSICDHLNLAAVLDELSSTPRVEHAVARMMKTAIYKQTHRATDVQIYQTGTDGNCLFRAISLGITGSQSQHIVIRDYIVNHMMDISVRNQMEELFTARKRRKTYTYVNHLAAMQQPGEWGTEQEIVAAANLFNISIICYSKYANRQFCLQHFSPHFATDPACTSACSHQTLFLVNSSGQHYNFAAVNLDDDTEE